MAEDQAQGLIVKAIELQSQLSVRQICYVKVRALVEKNWYPNGGIWANMNEAENFEQELDFSIALVEKDKTCS